MKKSFINKLVTFALVGVMAASFAGCGVKSNSAASSTTPVVDKIKKAGKIVLGTSADYPPYEFHKSVNGTDEIMGFDIDIAKAIAKDLGVTLEIKDIKFDGLLAALASGKVDMVLAGMTPTAERKKNVDFSDVYYTAEQSIIVRKDDVSTYSTLDALAGKTIGAQKGSIQEDLAKNEIKNANVKSLGKVTDLILELKSKRADAIIVEKVVAESFVNADSTLTLSDAKFSKQEKGSAVAIKKGSSDLVTAVNKTIATLKSDGTIDKLVGEANKQAE